VKAAFDTNILIDYISGIPQAKSTIDEIDEPIISAISWIEVMVGAKSSDEADIIRSFLNGFHLCQLTQDISEIAVAVRRARKIRLPDAIIWATAKHEGCMLITRNSRDFDPKAADIRIPYQL